MSTRETSTNEYGLHLKAHVYSEVEKSHIVWNSHMENCSDKISVLGFSHVANSEVGKTLKAMNSHIKNYSTKLLGFTTSKKNYIMLSSGLPCDICENLNIPHYESSKGRE